MTRREHSFQYPEIFQRLLGTRPFIPLALLDRLCEGGYFLLHPFARLEGKRLSLLAPTRYYYYCCGLYHYSSLFRHDLNLERVWLFGAERDAEGAGFSIADVQGGVHCVRGCQVWFAERGCSCDVSDVCACGIEQRAQSGNVRYSSAEEESALVLGFSTPVSLVRYQELFTW